MGTQWYRFNVMTRAMEFLYVKQQYNDIFTQCWQTTQREENRGRLLAEFAEPEGRTTFEPVRAAAGAAPPSASGGAA
eukprot:791663-Pyramimonas_sp.AAC.1